MTDLATVALAIGPATVTGLVGYFAARFQRDTARDETEAATLRARLEHAEAERRHRQGVYHDFLVSLDRFDGMMVGSAPGDEQAFKEWFNAYYGLLRGISLFGADSVQASTDRVNNFFNDLGDKGATESHRTNVPFHEGLKAVYPAIREGFIDEMAQVTAALRLDVAPDRNLPQLNPLAD